ncbi:MAG: EF-hand domain-containing protein [Rhizomicrobium sp.]
MSFAIGAATYATQRLASLFAQFSPSPSTPSDTPAAPAEPASAPAASSNALTGTAQPSLSNQILSALMGLQNAIGGTTSADPAQNLFNAMDSDGDGSVSQGEMETYVEKAGGTQGQADALYTALNPNDGSSGVTESQMASAAPQAGGVPHHHHHHHAGGASGSGSPVDSLMSLLDGNQDGSVSQDEFSSAVTANGGTAAEATSDFTALDSDKSGTLSSADFATAWQNIQSQQGGGSFVNTILDAFAKANNATATAAGTSVTA